MISFNFKGLIIVMLIIIQFGSNKFIIQTDFTLSKTINPEILAKSAQNFLKKSGLQILGENSLNAYVSLA